MSKNKQEKTNARVIIPGSLDNTPEPHEIDAAWILAKHYNCEIVFISPNNGYKIKTPDFEMNGSRWEMKSPQGNSKTTIANNLKGAKAQAANIVFDSRRTKIPDEKILTEIKGYLERHKSIAHVIIITKEKKVLAIQR